MLDPVVQSAFVVILTWLLKLAAHAAGIPVDDATLYTLAGAIVVFILSKLGVPVVRGLLPERAKGFLSKQEE